MIFIWLWKLQRERSELYFIVRINKNHNYRNGVRFGPIIGHYDTLKVASVNIGTSYSQFATKSLMDKTYCWRSKYIQTGDVGSNTASDFFQIHVRDYICYLPRVKVKKNIARKLRQNLRRNSTKRKKFPIPTGPTWDLKPILKGTHPH